jgi:hypothetical protein
MKQGLRVLLHKPRFSPFVNSPSFATTAVTKYFWFLHTSVCPTTVLARRNLTSKQKMEAPTKSTLSLTEKQELYGKLVSRLKEINHMEGISSLLNWDAEVLMPKGGSGTCEIHKTKRHSLHFMLHFRYTRELYEYTGWCTSREAYFARAWLAD